MGFAPQNLKLDGKYHNLKVTLTSKQKWALQARHGYFAPRGESNPEAAAGAADEAALVRRAQSGERDALEGLLRAHYDRIYGVCRRMTGNDADAADAAQDALLAVVRGLGGDAVD